MGMIAVFGGTFNPIHQGHIDMLNCLCDLDFIDKVILIPTKIPPHKTVSYLANEEDRLEMCRLASCGKEKVIISNIELAREGKSYTVDTVLSLKKQYPNNKIAITVGADMLVTFDKWKDYMTILNNATIITFFRNDTERELYICWVDKLKSLGAELIVIDRDVADVSSTLVRDKIACGESVEGLISDEVYGYIKQKGLYGEM